MCLQRIPFKVDDWIDLPDSLSVHMELDMIPLLALEGGVKLFDKM